MASQPLSYPHSPNWHNDQLLLVANPYDLGHWGIAYAGERGSKGGWRKLRWAEEVKVDGGNRGGRKAQTQHLAAVVCSGYCGRLPHTCGLNTRDELSQSSEDWNSKMAGVS